MNQTVPELPDGQQGRLRVAMIAGEASGDILGAGLIDALQQQVGELQLEGIGGPQMQARGLHSLYPMETLSVMGLVEVLRHLPELLKIRKALLQRWLADPPDVVIGIDAPDFNLTLEEKLRKAGIRTLHYVSPSVWAWRKRRVFKIKRAVDRILTLFPFEAQFYARHQVPVTCVGHPLADEIAINIDQQAARNELGIAEDASVIALLPGSRMGEVGRLAGLFIETARWLHDHQPNLSFCVPFANRATMNLFKQELAKQSGLADLQLVEGRSRTVMAAADVVLLASGTAALEAMLLKKPMVVSYRMNNLTYQILKRLISVSHYSLPNLLAGRTLVPEFIQDDATPQSLGAAVLNYLVERDQVKALKDEFTRLHEQLRLDANQQAATAVLEVVNS